LPEREKKKEKKGLLNEVLVLIFSYVVTGEEEGKEGKKKTGDNSFGGSKGGKGGAQI